MPSNDPAVPAAMAPPRRASGHALLWLALAVLLAAGGWKLYLWWPFHQQAVGQAISASDETAVGDPATAILALRREQHELAQRMSDATSSAQVLRDEVLGVGERAALLEQQVARIGNPRTQGEQALRLDEAELLLTIGEQQIELSSDVGNALHAYALADGSLAGLTDPSAVNLRQSLAQETAALRALPPDPRAGLAGQLDALESTLAEPPFVADTHAARARASLFDRVVGSMVEVHRTQAQDLLDPASRDAGLTAVRLEITLARLALERRDANAFQAALARADGWLPRLFSPATVERQRRLLVGLRQASLRIELPALGGTLAELRRLRQEQPEPAAATPTVPTGPTLAPPTNNPKP